MLNTDGRYLSSEGDEVADLYECMTVTHEEEVCVPSRSRSTNLSLLRSLSIKGLAIPLVALSMIRQVGGSSVDDSSGQSSGDSSEEYEVDEETQKIDESWCDLKASICSVLHIDSYVACVNAKKSPEVRTELTKAFRHCQSTMRSSNYADNPIMGGIHCIHNGVKELYNALMSVAGNMTGSSYCGDLNSLESNVSKIITSCGDDDEMDVDDIANYCPRISKYMLDSGSSVKESQPLAPVVEELTTLGTTLLEELTTRGITTRGATTTLKTLGTTALTTLETTTATTAVTTPLEAVGTTTLKTLGTTALEALGTTTALETTTAVTTPLETLGTTVLEALGTTTTTLETTAAGTMTLETSTLSSSTLKASTLEPGITDSTINLVLIVCSVFLLLVSAVIFSFVKYRRRNSKKRSYASVRGLSEVTVERDNNGTREEAIEMLGIE